MGFKINTKWFYKNDKNELVFKTATYLLAGTNTKNVKLSYEHDDYGWFSYEQALDKLRFKNDKEVLGKAYSFIKENKV